MTGYPLLTIVLAAGKGTRMRSAQPKVLHRIAGLSILGHVLGAAEAAGSSEIVVVIGTDMDAVRAEVSARVPRAKVFVQHEQLGTAHAVLAARDALKRHRGDVLVLVSDVPLLTPGSVARLRSALEAGNHVAVLGFKAADPDGYGRLVTDAGGALLAIREHEDASERERAISLCNSGVLAFRHPDLVSLLDRIGGANAQGERYLTDAVAMARNDGLRVIAVACPEEEGVGINSRDQLAAAERIYQDRARLRAMQEGATLIAPETVWFSHDTKLGRDVTIEPNVFFGPGVVVEDGVVIHANCHFVGARIRKGAEVGPFARFRPGADIGPGVHIGNFVEVKNSTLEEGAKANHLAYIGDGRVGPKTNIGAGTILCNYDGFRKHRTDIGAGAFIGSNTSLVAPVKVGDGAYIGSGSVITKDVPADALALERTEQHVRPGWAAKFRALMKRQRPPASG
jgi:bifunctional UDP-N-acetylglucosamine pyrophosphorylase/glucosamine-1-phosphate N-acetyltransferase